MSCKKNCKAYFVKARIKIWLFRMIGSRPSHSGGSDTLLSGGSIPVLFGCKKQYYTPLLEGRQEERRKFEAISLFALCSKNLKATHT